MNEQELLKELQRRWWAMMPVRGQKFMAVPENIYAQIIAIAPKGSADGKYGEGIFMKDGVILYRGTPIEMQVSE